MRRRALPLVGVLTALGCTARFAPVPESAVACRSDAECPSGLVCDTEARRCVVRYTADPEPPRVSTLKPTSAVSLEVTFSRPLDETSAADATLSSLQDSSEKELTLGPASLSADGRTVDLVT